MSDVWEIPFLNPKAKERVGYPTQKPILLLERIIQIATDKDDIVLDPFCGSGTTLVILNSIGAIPVQRNSGIDGFILNNVEQKNLFTNVKEDDVLIIETYKDMLDKIIYKKNIL